MAHFFLSHKWRMPKIVWFLMLFELPFTVANLALFGVASPNLYRTILWSFGGKMGWNSDPSTVLYAYANYRPVSIPLIWSSFNTQYHLVIGVTCMFFYLVKSTMWVLHVFIPIVSLLLHAALVSLWAYGIYIQTSPDTIDPNRMNNGLPWYLTRNCNVASDPNVRSYCMQAKSAFAVSIVMLSTYAIFMILSIWSLFPTAEQKTKRNSKLEDRRAEKMQWSNHSPVENEMTADQQWQHMWELQQLPRTPGTAGGMRSPMTPRTVAFNSLSGAESGHGQGHGTMSRGWQAKYGGHGGADVNPAREEQEYFSPSTEKNHTGMAF